MANGPAPGGDRAKRPRAASRRPRARGAASGVVAAPREKTPLVAAPQIAEQVAPGSIISPSSKQRGRDPLLSAICHDLRAPLAAVTMGANFVLQTTQRDDANSRSVKILEAMLRSCTQMERLIRNFADLSEIEGNAVSLRLGLHDAGEMAELAAAAMNDAARARSLNFEIVKPKPPITMRCDRERLLRAIGHIVENAVKVAPDGSTITLAVVLEGDMVSFSVMDRGPGLSPQVKKNLYDRHWHAKRASRVGAGFGLAIARGFVAAHEGSLGVDSRPDDQTTFTLAVPKDGPVET